MTSKVDTDSLPPDEARIARMYGNRRPLNPVDRFRQAKRKQYFDSGDYAVAQSGKQDAVTPGALGQQHPSPETIPHPHPATPPTVGVGGGAGPNLPRAHAAASGQPQQHQQQGSSNGVAGSPVKETSFLSRETSADDVEAAEDEGKGVDKDRAGDEADEEKKEEDAPVLEGEGEGEGLPART